MTAHHFPEDNDIEAQLRAELAAQSRELAGLRAKVGMLGYIAERVASFAQHADSCGDRDAYNQATIPSCGCGLDSALDALHEYFSDAAIERSKQP